MISLTTSRISDYLDYVPLTKEARVEYYKECVNVINTIKKVISLGHKTNADVGVALKTVVYNKFKINPCNQLDNVYRYGRQSEADLNQLREFLMCLGYDKSASSCIIRTIKAPLSIRGKEVFNLIKINRST